MAQVMGIKHIRDGVEAQAVLGADMSVIAVVGTAPLANATTFPLDKVTLVRTNDTALRQALGSTGTIPDALTGISAQISDAAAKVVVVRVDDNVDPDLVIANILGSEALGTGMWALLDAPEELGETPRLIIVPGYTAQTENGVTSITVSTGGSGYTADFAVTATGGSGTGFKVKVGTGIDDVDTALRTVIGYVDEAQAKQKAGAEGKRSDREKGGGSVSILGDPNAEPEALCNISGIRPGIDGSYRIAAVTHNLSKGGGFTTELDLKQPQNGAGVDKRGSSRSLGSASAGTGASGSASGAVSL